MASGRGSGYEPAEVLVRTLLLSLDPANRVWLTLGPSYLEELLRVGSIMPGFAIGGVEESGARGFGPGDLVTGVLGWQDFNVVPAASVQHLPDLPGLPLDAFLCLTSVVGLTAYVGIIDVLDVQARPPACPPAGRPGSSSRRRQRPTIGEPPTSEAILDGLWTVKNDNLGGLTHPLTFVKDQKPTPSTCWFNAAIAGNAWASPDGFKLQCAG